MSKRFYVVQPVLTVDEASDCLYFYTKMSSTKEISKARKYNKAALNALLNVTRPCQQTTQTKIGPRTFRIIAVDKWPELAARKAITNKSWNEILPKPGVIYE